MADQLVYSSIAGSNMQPEAKSAISRWFDKMKGGGGMQRLSQYRGNLVEGGHALRQSGESVVVGGILGAAHAALDKGLDLGGKVPLDAVVGVMGMIGGVAMANEGIGADLRNAGASGLSVFAFRKGFDLTAEVRAKKGLAPGGKFGAKIAGDSDYTDADGYTADDDMGEDPIIAAAKRL
jgi:hypothetical protein